ncbi:hypothetical protein MVEN_00016300 [Mycena venus]|uniref:Protein kinase domain-containing protein n=1 Tax=Mycena venus TaxID=2733690 RepID=A0A8H7DGQ6_9AGAR|nr:hypothetical protein MVEN_00016300 [Mycena venus]
MSFEVPSYEFRELHFNQRSESDVAVVFHEQMAARKFALQAPLQTDLQFTLALEVPLQNPAPEARELPSVPSSGPTTVQLCDELQQGIDGFSQVWTAVCVGGPGTRLVLKIIQPSICRGILSDEYYEPWDLAHNEAWVYRHLPHYQGLLIPYFFGLSTIVTPCGEEAWVLVLEFIPGITVNSVADSASISDIRDFCARGVEAVQKFVHGGWSLRDIRPPNFILTGGPGARAVVIIDLFLSEPIKSTSDAKFIANDQPRSFFQQFVSCVYDVDEDIFEWAKKELPRFVWSPAPLDSGSEEDQAVDSESVA